MSARAFLEGVTPPYVMDAVRRRRTRDRPTTPEWEYVGTTWVDDADDGWDAAAVAAAYAAKLPEFRAAVAAPRSIGVPTEALLAPVVNQYDQNIALVYAYAVARAAARRPRVSILDWGGGFGFLAIVTRELFPDLDVDFHVKELPSTARAARTVVEDVTFWDDDSCLEREYDLVSACSSLQYSPDWRTTLTHLGAAAPFTLLTRTPVAITPTSFVVRQRAYGTRYVGWVLSRDELLAAAAAAGLVLERELLEGWSAEVLGAPARDEHRGYLFSNPVLPARSDGPAPA